MAFASSPHKNGTGLNARSTGRLDNRPGSVNSTIKPVTPPAPATASPPMRPKSASPSSSVNTGTRRGSGKNGSDNGGVPGRVRVAVRLRPRNGEEMVADMDFADCVELQPELKRLKLRKNNWDCETYQFDEILTETASQKRVYEVVAKPVVESVLEGYNGTVMAYGQTGTGKTFTLGRLGEEDTADRGIMVRAMEDILANVSSVDDTVTVSYLQLYMETVQDLLAPEKDNIAIVEDPKTGDVSVPSATHVELQDQRSFVRLLQAGEANRFAANTKLNTESSRSHAILLVNVRKVVKPKTGDRELIVLNENGGSPQVGKNIRAPTVRKSKLLIVDLAGSERVDKSGSEGHTLEEAKSINLSLTALGKCINALAENSPHVPIRDSKLTRMLRDSFGGTARTSLIVTIGPSPRHRGETASTIMFGQRAMKVENMVKLKEEFDYKSLCRRLETELDRLVAENERQVKARQDEEEENERKLEDTRECAAEAESKLAAAMESIEAERKKFQQDLAEAHQNLEKAEKELKNISQDYQHEKKERNSHAEKLKLQRDLTDAMQKHQKELTDEKQRQQKELADAIQNLELERGQRKRLEQELNQATQELNEATQHLHVKNESLEQGNEVLELKLLLEKETQLREELEQEIQTLKSQPPKLPNGIEAKHNEELLALRRRLDEELKHRERLEEEVRTLREQLTVLSDEGEESRKIIDKVGSGRSSEGSQSPSVHKPTSHMRDTINGQRATIAKLFEQVGLQKILSLLESEDVDVRVHAVKVVANLAAEEANQEKIVEAGGLGSLLMLLQSSEDETIRRVAAGAVANLAMNETNQELIMAQGGIGLLARTADDAEDPQTLRMVAGAIANLCGNDKLQIKLREEGGIRALLGMVRSRHPDVLAQVARGIANFAKCESRGAAQGYKTGRSLLIDDGALPWIVANANNDASPIRRHIELALCHLAQHEVNAKDLVAGGALWELVRISRECSREDIRNLAQRTLNASNTFQTELKRLQLVY
ncbi:hypothetical protein MPTK1_4g06510 [Marchantia polymorpha subsp. ruderalis]|uniref:Protein ARMADILLO REPEAT KINESIN1 n=4 Tax=Marchantia polymorpha TaxID=3197 RepID=A0AAF6B716_MARPO|nr:hypothetical protein MARPO_0114s0009 [Marchantia polymorpha]BBN07800.1 hypothetical protein Mp_4g06510 [Marchantia polymorpha subsp. ruderalis]|eukprot:PTQ31187.1 hypothetical protein MARPO_0114s0009 [Marchantia polymorpha]